MSTPTAQFGASASRARQRIFLDNDRVIAITALVLGALMTGLTLAVILLPNRQPEAWLWITLVMSALALTYGCVRLRRNIAARRRFTINFEAHSVDSREERRRR
jgi:hypothetical protein